MAEATLEILARADSATALPRLGGMARPDGVVIVSERFWAFAGVDGSLREGEMTGPPRALRRVPLVRGLLRLASAISPVVRRNGVVRPRERWFLIGAIVASFAFYVLPDAWELPAGLTLTVAMLAWVVRGRSLHLHGAEHRAIRAVDDRDLLATWFGGLRPSRIATRCGTNFTALVFPIAVLFDRVWTLPAAAGALLALGLTMELWIAIEGRTHRIARAFIVPGLLLQRLTTREPRLDETRVALRAAASVLRRELG